MRSLLTRRDLFASSSGVDDRIHIASLLLQVMPAEVESIRAAVASLPDAEFHPTAHPNKFAVVLEAGNERALSAATEQLSGLPGVLTVSIVAHLTERADSLEDEV